MATTKTTERDTEQWCELLTIRCKTHGVDLWLKPTELYGWVAAGVSPEDDPDDVFAALCETLADTGDEEVE